MSIKKKLPDMTKTGLGFVAMAVVLVLLLAIPVFLVAGGLVVGLRVLPWLLRASGIVFVIDIIFLLPLALIRVVRPWSGLGLVISSYIFGLTGWFTGLILTWSLWGGFAVIIGLCFLGVGVVPMAMLATLFKGMWPELGFLIFAMVCTFGLRILGLMFEK